MQLPVIENGCDNSTTRNKARQDDMVVGIDSVHGTDKRSDKLSASRINSKIASAGEKKEEEQSTVSEADDSHMDLHLLLSPTPTGTQKSYMQGDLTNLSDLETLSPMQLQLSVDTLSTGNGATFSHAKPMQSTIDCNSKTSSKKDKTKNIEPTIATHTLCMSSSVNAKSIRRSSNQMNESTHLSGNAACATFLDRLFSHTAVQDYGVELPTIAVMGDTSSGKSSVLSQLCMVELPKSQSLTTLCPTRLILKRADVRRAIVSVHWISTTDPTEQLPLPHFPEQEFGPDNWHEIPHAITDAQKFILNHTQREVSNDIVCVAVQGPAYYSATELTVIDLPGIMRSKAGIHESNSLRTEIANLQIEYLCVERCIIVAVHPANVDWHNAQITADALLVDPETRRTIVVLTKPDLIDPGAEKVSRHCFKVRVCNLLWDCTW